MRAHLRIAAIGTGTAVSTTVMIPEANKAIVLYLPGTTTPWPHDVYTTRTGATTYTPGLITTDSLGRWEGWSEYAGPVGVSIDGAAAVIEDFVPDHGPEPFRAMTFGATGDGATDDYSAIMRAIDAVDTAGGGILEFDKPSVRYAISAALEWPDGVHLVGSGAAHCAISRGGVADPDPAHLDKTIATSLNVINGANLNDASIRGLALAGGVNGLELRGACADLELTDVRITQTGRHGIQSDQSERFVFTDVQTGANEGCGWRAGVRHGGDGSTAKFEVYGWYSQGTGAAGATGEDAIYLSDDGSSAGAVSGVFVQPRFIYVPKHGLRMERSSYVTVINPTVENAGTTADNTYDGIHATVGGNTALQIVNPNINNNATNPTGHRYGIYTNAAQFLIDNGICVGRTKGIKVTNYGTARNVQATIETNAMDNTSDGLQVSLQGLALTPDAGRKTALQSVLGKNFAIVLMDSLRNATGTLGDFEVIKYDANRTRLLKVASSDGNLLMRGPIFASNQSTAGDYAGSGTPEGAVTANPGSTYRRTDGGAGTSFYVKESGVGNTGWVAK